MIEEGRTDFVGSTRLHFAIQIGLIKQEKTELMNPGYIYFVFTV